MPMLPFSFFASWIFDPLSEMIFSTIENSLLAGVCSDHSVQSGIAENQKLFYHLHNWKAFSSLNKNHSLFSFNSCIYFDLSFANEYIILLLPLGNLSFALTSFKTYLIVFVSICISLRRGKINYLSALGSLNAVLLVLKAGRFHATAFVFAALSGCLSPRHVSTSFCLWVEKTWFQIFLFYDKTSEVFPGRFLISCNFCFTVFLVIFLLLLCIKTCILMITCHNWFRIMLNFSKKCFPFGLLSISSYHLLQFQWWM